MNTNAWMWWALPGEGRGVLVALDGAPVELEVWSGGGWTETRARWRLAGSGRVLAWVVAAAV